MWFILNPNIVAEFPGKKKKQRERLFGDFMKIPYRQNRKVIVAQLIMLIFLMFFGLLWSSCESRKNKNYQVGVLNGFPPLSAIFDGFKGKMTELGYIEGENISYDAHTIEKDETKQREALENFIKQKVDLIYVFPTGVTYLTKELLKGVDIPVISGYSVIRPNGLVETIERPGGNITGVRFGGGALTAKRYEILYEITPEPKRIFITYNRQYAASADSLKPIREAAVLLNATLVELPVTSLEELKSDLQSREKLNDIGFDGIQVMTDILTQSPEGWRIISDFADRHKIPISASAPTTIDHSVVYLGYDFYEVGSLSAPLADKIFKGIHPSVIPIVTPEYHLTINLKRAREIGLHIPEGLLGMARDIIQ